MPPKKAQQKVLNLSNARQNFLNVLKARKEPRAKITKEVSEALVERNKRAFRGLRSKNVLAIIEELGIKSEQKSKYVLNGLNKAEKMGLDLNDPAYLRDIIEHLSTEYDLLIENKHPKNVYHLGISPFYVLELKKELQNIPKEYSRLGKTIINYVIRGFYPDIPSAVEFLRKIDLDISKNLPKEYSDLSKTIRHLIFGKKYSDVSSAVESLRKIDLDISKNLPLEYSDLSDTIRGLLFGKKYSNVTSEVEILRKIDLDISKNLPSEYSDLSKTIRGLVFSKTYPNVFSVVKILRKIELDISNNLPFEYYNFRKTIRNSILTKNYPDIYSVISTLRKIELTLSKELPKEYLDFYRTIRSLLFAKRYPNINSILEAIKHINKFLKGLNLSRGVEIKLIQYSLSKKTKTNTYEDAFDNATKYFIHIFEKLGLDINTIKVESRNPQKTSKLVQQNRELAISIELSNFLGVEKYLELLDHLEYNDTLPEWAEKEIEKFKKRL